MCHKEGNDKPILSKKGAAVYTIANDLYAAIRRAELGTSSSSSRLKISQGLHSKLLVLA